MAASTNASLDVHILADDRRLKRSYEMAPNTRLAQVMTTWKNDCEETGNWIFISADRKDVFVEEFLTLEMVGETVPNTGLVTLRVQLLVPDIPRPTTDIFGFVKNGCHHLQVEPNQKFGEILLQLRERPMEVAYNGLLLDLRQTVNEAKLDNYAVIAEPCRQINISVKLSNGETMIFRVPDNSYVLHLKNKVNRFETKDFSLVYQGRYLHHQESVRNLCQHLVEVATAEFNVHINGQCISWTTRAEAIGFHNFLSQLAVNGGLDRKQLETIQFRCAGCERRISISDENPQLIPIDCCSQRSQTLITSSSSDTKSQMELESMIQHIQDLYKQLEVLKKKNVRTDSWRVQCRKTNEDFLKHGLQYNIITRMCEGLRGGIGELNDKIKSLEVKNEELIKETNKSECKIQTLWMERQRTAKTIQTLEEGKRKSVMTIQTLKDERRKSVMTIQTLEEERRKSVMTIQTLEEERRKSVMTIQTLEEERRKLVMAIRTLEEEKRKSVMTIQTLEEERRKSVMTIQTLEEERRKSVMTIQTLEEERRKSVMTIQSLKGETIRATVAIQTLEDERKKTSATIQSLKEQERKSEMTIQTLEEDKRKASMMMQSLKEETIKSEMTIQILKEKAEKAFMTIQTLEEEKKKALTMIKTLEEEKKKSSMMMQSLREEKRKSAMTIQTLEEKKKKASMTIQTLEEEKRRSAVTMQKLEEGKKRSEEEIQTLTFLVQEVGAFGSTPPTRTPTQEQGVKLLVRYYPKDFSPVVSPWNVMEQGQYAWTVVRHIKCFIPQLHSGWQSFVAVRGKLQPLFTKNRIRGIDQRRNEENVEVTSLVDDEMKENLEDEEFSSNGWTLTWEGAGRPKVIQGIHEGGKIFICHGGRRTVLDILPL